MALYDEGGPAQAGPFSFVKICIRTMAETSAESEGEFHDRGGHAGGGS